ncbi:Ser-Thr-rich glycosyl-phosphatidyl-inositol-anchored membrane family-domain-containing protein [Aspergillus bertholletiae]|uniref:Ser-Thr-rich glycosyl-phosphatidyl-inositol-anchored membrane family-domain-containing protein n=1 Tax=Aspergillus bertholletiae TaxID=1226010 RepID=A0A5N7B1L4_9EURO|nr:Ser-Thr-rich glycosyl-phosphatidyl-inositol-anchored membrane family-domain-containing protein [Aspergillus bertholletiae]
MRFFQIASIVAYAASSLALTITSPQNGDKVDFSKPYTIKWTTVPSDPEQINIVLKNQTTSEKQIAKDVKSSDGKYTIDKIWDIQTGTGYQFNFVSNSKQNTGILAQSQIFNVTDVADPPKPSSTATKSASSTSAAPTESTGGSAALTVPAAGSLMLSLFALAL